MVVRAEAKPVASEMRDVHEPRTLPIRKVMVNGGVTITCAVKPERDDFGCFGAWIESILVVITMALLHTAQKVLRYLVRSRARHSPHMSLTHPTQDPNKTLKLMRRGCEEVHLKGMTYQARRYPKMIFCILEDRRCQCFRAILLNPPPILRILSRNLHPTPPL